MCRNNHPYIHLHHPHKESNKNTFNLNSFLQMKTNYKLFLSILFLVGFTSLGLAQTTIYSNNFESNNGGWTDGGDDCEFRGNDSNSPQGNASWRIKDDSGNSSAFWQDFDFSGYDEIIISFSFVSDNFDDDDDRFEFLIDNNRIEEYRYSRDGWMSNGTRYTRSITVNKYDYNLNGSNQIKFETTKDTGNEDYLYIDEIEIIGTDYDYDYLFYENFSDDTSDGDANDFSGTDDSGNNIAWTANEEGAADRWDITRGMWRGKEVYTESSLTTSQINISGYEDLKFSFYIDYDDVDDNNDWIKVFYTIDNNSEVLLASYLDEDDNQTYTVDLPSSAIGSNIVLRIEMHQDDNNNEHRIDNIKLTGVYNPCEAPTAFNVTGNNLTYCEGDSANTAIGLNNSQSGVSYQLLRNGNNQGSAISGTGNAITFGNFSAAGTYTVEATRTDGGCTETMNNDVVITINEVPTANFTVTSTNIGINESIAFNNTSTGSNNTYAWDFGDGTGTSTSENPSYTFTISGTYTVTLTTTNSCGTDTITTDVTVTINYCNISENDSRYQDGITSVQFGTINNQTGIDDNDGYVDYTNISTTVSRGNSENISVRVNTAGDYTYYTSVWIDWNNDGNFSESSERYNLGFTTNETNGTTSLSPLAIMIPTDAVLAATRMRVVTEYSDYPNNACSTVSYGEIEDYTIVIEDSASSLTDIAIQDWDDNTDWDYTTTVGSEQNSGFGASSGDFWALEGDNDDGTISFDTEDIESYYENVTLSFDYFVSDNTESNDVFAYSIYYNGSSTAEDTVDLITNGEGTGGNWLTESILIPDNTTSVEIVFNSDVTAGDENIGLDNVKLQADAINTWTGDLDDAIIDTTKWTAGVVPGEEDVLMVGSGNLLKITDDRTFKTVIVNTGAFLTITKTGSVTTVEDFINKGTDNVNMWSDDNEFSSLIVNGTSTGALNYNRWVNNYEVGTNGNDCISSPVAGDTWQNVMSNNTDVLYNNGTIFSFTPYINGGNGWGSMYTNTTTANITSGIGYRVATFANGSAPIKFTGTVLNSDVTVPLNRAQTRWNVVGNPYTSYINLGEFLTENINELDTDYVVVLGYNGVNNTDGWIYYNLSSAIESNVTIAPGQGFYLAAKTNSSVVTFKPSMRTFEGEDDFLQNGMRNAEQTVQKMRLNVAKGNQARHSELYFLDYNGVSDDFDLGFDSYVYNGSDSFNIYSTLVNNTTNTDKLAIQSMTMENVLESVIALGVHAQAGQQITFSIDQVTTGEETLVYLEDRATDTWTLLNDGNTFTVTPNTNLTGTGRFYLHLQDEGRLSTTEFNADLNQVGIKSINGTKQLVITGELAEDTQVSIYDMTGKLVLNNTIKAFNQTNRINVAQINTGVYVVSLKNNSQSVSKQVLIN